MSLAKGKKKPKKGQSKMSKEVPMISEIQVGGQDFIQLENSSHQVLISLYGAQVLALHDKASGEDWLWLSELSPIQPGRAIRGGIPLCWPIFGGDKQGKLPSHGVARIQKWALIGDDEDSANDSVAVTLRLRDNDFSRQFWPYAFQLEFAVRLSTNRLECELTAINNDVRSFEYSQAFHPYFKVSALGNVRLMGLDGREFMRNGADAAEVWHDGDTLDMARDDAFLGCNLDDNLEVCLHDSGFGRTIELTSSLAPDLTVWNPYQAGAAAFVDMPDDGYKQMLCVEPSQIGLKTLEPSQQVTMRMVIACKE
jgi:glucose-6-phosphate 1-epimerase